VSMSWSVPVPHDHRRSAPRQVTRHHFDRTIRWAGSRSAVRPSGPASASPASGGLHRIVAVAVAVIATLIVAAAVLPASPLPAAGAQNTPAGGAASGTLTAFVAANATDVFNTAIDRFEHQQPGVSVKPSYAGTQILLTQLEQGAQVDLFLSADEAHAQQAVTDGLIPRYDPVSSNSEVIVVPRSNPAGVSSLQDLATKPVKVIIGVPTVPIGIYTRQIFTNATAQYGPEFPQQALATWCPPRPTSNRSSTRSL